MKPIVHYRPHLADSIVRGHTALLFGGTTDHPHLRNDGSLVRTSRVIALDINVIPGCFETENTIYHPEE